MLENFLFNSLLWDKPSYIFNRYEKDMNPFSIHLKDGKIILVHNVTGINKKDLKVEITDENNQKMLVISGKTYNECTSSYYSVKSKFILDKSKKIKNISSKAENGLLYITIEYEKDIPKVKTSSVKTIDIE